MFVSFLNKTNPCCPDRGALSTYHPGQILFYFISAPLYIDLDDYWALKENALDSGDIKSPAQEWLHLIDKDLNAGNDLLNLKENDYLESLGPYYYPRTNTCFFFCKQPAADQELLTASDLEILQSLHEIPTPEPAVQTYGKNKKAVKRYTRNKDELLRDIRMCLTALNHMSTLKKHINFWEKSLEIRQELLSHPQLLPAEPGNPPSKPENPVEDILPGNSFLSVIKRKLKQNPPTDYQHHLKIYYIRYREYEKACDRFKEVLGNWSDLAKDFRSRCQQDSSQAEEKLLIARHYLSLYNLILARSMVHQKYQESFTLNTFQQYLETGRADDLQECMNIYEEESLWNELKAGQTRIENTIYLLQNDNTPGPFTQEQIDQYPVEPREEILRARA